MKNRLNHTLNEMQIEDYKNYFHISERTFNKLMRRVEPFLARKEGQEGLRPVIIHAN